MKGNVIVGQSGGPTSAINSSLAGVYRTAIDRERKRYMECVTGSRAFWRKSILTCPSISGNELDEELLKRTPAAYLGSCRYKLTGNP